MVSYLWWISCVSCDNHPRLISPFFVWSLCFSLSLHPVSLFLLLFPGPCISSCVTAGFWLPLLNYSFLFTGLPFAILICWIQFKAWCSSHFELFCVVLPVLKHLHSLYYTLYALFCVFLATAFSSCLHITQPCSRLTCVCSWETLLPRCWSWGWSAPLSSGSWCRHCLLQRTACRPARPLLHCCVDSACWLWRSMCCSIH